MQTLKQVASGDSTPKQILIVSGRQKPRSNPLGFNECDVDRFDILLRFYYAGWILFHEEKGIIDSHKNKLKTRIYENHLVEPSSCQNVTSQHPFKC